jgi:hypothetical protein
MPRPRLSLSEELSGGLVLPSVGLKAAVDWCIPEGELVGVVPLTVTVAVEGAKLSSGVLSLARLLVVVELVGAVDVNVFAVKL